MPLLRRASAMALRASHPTSARAGGLVPSSDARCLRLARFQPSLCLVPVPRLLVICDLISPSFSLNTSESEQHEPCEIAVACRRRVDVLRTRDHAGALPIAADCPGRAGWRGAGAREAGAASAARRTAAAVAKAR